MYTIIVPRNLTNCYPIQQRLGSVSSASVTPASATKIPRINFLHNKPAATTNGPATELQLPPQPPTRGEHEDRKSKIPTTSLPPSHPTPRPLSMSRVPRSIVRNSALAAAAAAAAAASTSPSQEQQPLGNGNGANGGHHYANGNGNQHRYQPKVSTWIHTW